MWKCVHHVSLSRFDLNLIGYVRDAILHMLHIMLAWTFVNIVNMRWQCGARALFPFANKQLQYHWSLLQAPSVPEQVLQCSRASYSLAGEPQPDWLSEHHRLTCNWYSVKDFHESHGITCSKYLFGMIPSPCAIVYIRIQKKSHGKTWGVLHRMYLINIFTLLDHAFEKVSFVQCLTTCELTLDMKLLQVIFCCQWSAGGRHIKNHFVYSICRGHQRSSETVRKPMFCTVTPPFLTWLHAGWQAGLLLSWMFFVHGSTKLGVLPDLPWWRLVFPFHGCDGNLAKQFGRGKKKSRCCVEDIDVPRTVTSCGQLKKS